MITIISPEEFKKELEQWGASNSNLNKVRAMQKRNVIYLRFAIPNKDEIIETRISKDEFERFAFMNFAHMIVGAIWNDEIDEIKNLQIKLDELNANTSFNRGPYLLI